MHREPIARVSKQRIAIQLPLREDLREELHVQAERFNWQIYDLNINGLAIPTNPPPAGAIIDSPDNFPAGDEDKRLPFPTVRIGNGSGYVSDKYPMVLLDPRQAGRMAATYFAERGYKDLFVILRGDPDGISPRYQGVFDTAEELGIRCHKLRLQEDKEKHTSAETRIKWADEIGDFINSLPRPLAFMGNNDHFAARVSFICESCGIAIPEDVAVMGINNDFHICRESPVPLSSIDVDYPLQIQRAAELLNEIMEGGAPPSEPIIIPPRAVIARRSTDVLAVTDSNVARALRFMWDHLAWPISVDDVAYEVGVSRRTLDRTFRKELGRGANGELKRKRLEYCCELLEKTTMTVEEINKKIGIRSKTYLHRIFLETYGRTPMKYREEMKHARKG